MIVLKLKNKKVKYGIINMLSSAHRVGGGDSMEEILKFILAVIVQVLGNYLYKLLDDKLNKRDDN